MKIVFDAGHGTNTAGKRSPDGTIREWRINDQVVDELLILASKYENVSTLRVDDPTGARDVPLSERTKKANAWGADIYVSVHQNAFGSGWNTADGVETYAYNAGSKAVPLAKSVQAELISQMKADDRGVKFANFQVLRETTMPAILVECGFMTNAVEAGKMKSSTWIKATAKAIMDGIRKAYSLKPKAAPAPAPKPTVKPASTPKPIVNPPKTGDTVHRVVVDGKQVGAYQSNAAIGKEVEKALATNPRTIMIELVK